MKKPWWAKKNEEKWEQLLFNYNLLTEIKKKNGELHCEYCGKPELKIYKWYERLNKKDVATVDHFLPKSQYPDLAKEPTNLIVCCDSCNNKKGDKLWEESTIKYRR